jgi:hypothetical protein
MITLHEDLFLNGYKLMVGEWTIKEVSDSEAVSQVLRVRPGYADMIEPRIGGIWYRDTLVEARIPLSNGSVILWIKGEVMEERI